MLKYYEFCPKCQGTRRMGTSVALKTVPGHSGGMHEILVTLYHCETCGTFIYSRSETEEVEMQTAGYVEIEPAWPLT